MLTFLDKCLLKKFYYISKESVAEALQRFWIEDKKWKKKNEKALLVLQDKYSLSGVSKKREECRIGLAVDHRNCHSFEPPLWLHKCVLQGNSQWEENPTTMQWTRSWTKQVCTNTSVFWILHSVLQLQLYKLQSLQQLLPDDNWQMTQLSKGHFQIRLCWNLKKIYYSGSCGQMRLTICCMEQLVRKTAESEQRRIYMHSKRNFCTHHILLFCVGLSRKLLRVPFSLKSLIQD